MLALVSGFLGCAPDSARLGYSFYLQTLDSTRAEWLRLGSSEWESHGQPDRNHLSSITRAQAGGIFSEMDIPPEEADLWLPSLQFDSLRIIQHINGVDSIVYEGVEDEDWDYSLFDKVRSSYLLRLP